MRHQKFYCRMVFVIMFLFLTTLTTAKSSDQIRWEGHSFVFAFVTDDGTNYNLGWADVARQMGFRFTIAVNQSADHPLKLTAADMHTLYEDGFEIANHGYGHGHTGVSPECPIPPRGSFLAYYMCDGFEPGEAMTLFKAEIERDSLSSFVGMPLEAVRSVAYPNHRYSTAVIDTLMDEGYLGARYGENSSYSSFSYGEFTTPARNSWDGGISLFRVPLTHYSLIFFGNHSADPPVHFTHEEFVAATQPYIDQAVIDGGMFIIYAHHFGDDDDSYGDINYHAAGVTPLDLEWMVDLVRQNNGVVMTFGDALAYYRARSDMVEIDGDYVWIPRVSGVSEIPGADRPQLAASPNPFNALTTITMTTMAAGPVAVTVYDLAGRRVRSLADGYRTGGTHSFPWDGRDESGAIVSSGVYQVRLKTASESSSILITLLK